MLGRVDEARRHRVVVPARELQLRVVLAVELADAAHADLPHVLPDDRSQRDREVPRVGIDLETNLTDAVDLVPALATASGERSTRCRLEASRA